MSLPKKRKGEKALCLTSHTTWFMSDLEQPCSPLVTPFNTREGVASGPLRGAMGRALLRRVGANTHARRETSRRSSVARCLAPSGCRMRAPLPVRRLIINACARRASVCTAYGSVADSVHTADICFHPMVLLRVAGHRGRCCLCEWHAIPDLARTRSRPTGQQALRARATTGRPSSRQHRRPQPRLPTVPARADK